MKNESSYFNEKQYRYDLSGLFSLKRRIALVKTTHVRYVWQTSVISNNEPAAKIIQSVSRLGAQFPSENDMPFDRTNLIELIFRSIANYYDFFSNRALQFGQSNRIHRRYTR